MGADRTPVLPGHSLLINFSSLLSAEESALLLGHVFWGCHISRWGFSTRTSCLVEVGPHYCLKRFALVTLEMKQPSSSASCCPVKLCYSGSLIAAAVRKWAWQFFPFPVSSGDIITNRPFGLLGVRASAVFVFVFSWFQGYTFLLSISKRFCTVFT